MSNQIKIGAIISYAAILVNIGLGLLYTPWMVKQIGVSDYGIYSLSSAFLSYFVMDFGLGSAIARYISKAVAKGDKKAANHILNTSLRIYVVIDSIIFITLIVVYFFINGIFGNLHPDEIEKFKIVYCIAGLFSILSFPFTPINGLLIAKEKFITLKSCELIQRISICLLMVAFLLAGYGLYTLVLINGLIGLLIWIYKLYFARTDLGLTINLKTFDSNLAKALFKFSVWVFIIGIAQRLMVNICPTVLGITSSTTQISIFAIAATLEGYVWTFASAMNGLFLPKVTNLSLKQGGNRDEILSLMIKIGRLQLIIVGLLISGITVLGQPFIKLWMGPTFSSSYYIIILMIVPGYITLTQEIANTLLYVENEVKYRAFLFLFSAIIGMAVSFSLSKSLGAVGCGIGIFISLILCHVIGINFVYKFKLGLNIKRFFKECHIKMVIPIIISITLFSFLQKYIEVNSWIKLIIFGTAFSCFYITLMWILSMNNFEKTLIKSLILKFKNKI